MNLYFENFSLLGFITFIVKHRASYQNFKNLTAVFYIDRSLMAGYFLPVISRLLNQTISRIDFNLTAIKDKNGELISLRIHRKDLFAFQEKIRSHEAYKQSVKGNIPHARARNYLDAGLIVDHIVVEDSVARLKFIVEVVNWHMQGLGIKSGILIAKNRAWQDIHRDCASKKNVQLIFQEQFLKAFSKKFNLVRYLSGLPPIYLLLKIIKYKKFRFSRTNDQVGSQCNLFVEGRGDVKVGNDGLNSDFFWQMNSEFPKGNILYKYQTTEERRQLEQYGIVPVDGSVDLKALFRLVAPRFETQRVFKYKKEHKEIRAHFKRYASQYLFWYSFFKKHHARIFLTWYKYDNSSMVMGDAIKSLDGVSAVWQIAFDGHKMMDCKLDVDVVFSHSKFSVAIDRQMGSKYLYNVISGYPKDYIKNVSQKAADKLRKQLQSYGAKNIVCVLDENSLDDSRWHTGHQMQQENYSYILEELFRNKELGVIFKPKAANTLGQRLGEVNKLLIEARKTGRCFVFDQSGRYTTSAPPTLAALASDICVHGHLCAGTGAIECVLAGVPTLLVDREGTPYSKLQELPHGKVVFKDWPETIEALREYCDSSSKATGFGDWSLIKDELDPFNDGCGAYRMGGYLNLILKGLEKGLGRDAAMSDAAGLYSKEWGADKIVVEESQ